MGSKQRFFEKSSGGGDAWTNTYQRVPPHGRVSYNNGYEQRSSSPKVSYQQQRSSRSRGWSSSHLSDQVLTNAEVCDEKRKTLDLVKQFVVLPTNLGRVKNNFAHLPSAPGRIASNIPVISNGPALDETRTNKKTMDVDSQIELDRPSSQSPDISSVRDLSDEEINDPCSRDASKKTVQENVGVISGKSSLKRDILKLPASVTAANEEILFTSTPKSEYNVCEANFSNCNEDVLDLNSMQKAVAQQRQLNALKCHAKAHKFLAAPMESGNERNEYKNEAQKFLVYPASQTPLILDDNHSNEMQMFSTISLVDPYNSAHRQLDTNVLLAPPFVDVSVPPPNYTRTPLPMQAIPHLANFNSAQSPSQTFAPMPTQVYMPPSTQVYVPSPVHIPPTYDHVPLSVSLPISDVHTNCLPCFDHSNLQNPQQVSFVPMNRASSLNEASSSIAYSLSRMKKLPSAVLPCELSASSMDSPTNAYRGHMSKLMEKCESLNFVDTRCKLDEVFESFCFNALDGFEVFKKRNSSTWSPNYVGCITDFSIPSRYSNDIANFFEEILSNDDVYGSIGCRPSEVTCYEADTEAIILSKASHPKILAIGEIGLDYSTRVLNRADRETQKVIFERQLMLVKEVSKPIVLHCKESEDDCFGILRRMLPHDYPIHWHGFDGSTTVYQQWSQYFTKLYFGVASGIYKSENKELIKFYSSIPLNRLLIETESPNSFPRNYPKEELNGLANSHPGLGGLIGLTLAELRKEPVETVFETLVNNTMRIYTFC